MKEKEEVIGVWAGDIEREFLNFLAESIANDITTLYLTTPGGDAYIAWAAHDLIKARAPNLTIIGLGQVFSAGLVIMGAVRKRWATPSTIFFSHPPYLTVPDKLSTPELETEQVECRRLWDKCLEMFEIPTDEPIYFTPQEAKQWKVITRVL